MRSLISNIHVKQCAKNSIELYKYETQKRGNKLLHNAFLVVLLTARDRLCYLVLAFTSTQIHIEKCQSIAGSSCKHRLFRTSFELNAIHNLKVILTARDFILLWMSVASQEEKTNWKDN